MLQILSLMEPNENGVLGSWRAEICKIITLLHTGPIYVLKEKTEYILVTGML